VAEVVPHSPAQLAGLRTGDVIVGAEGAAVKHTKDILLAISESSTRGRVRLEINRVGRSGTVDVSPTDAPPFQQALGR
jgi:serine protease Do